MLTMYPRLLLRTLKSVCVLLLANAGCATMKAQSLPAPALVPYTTNLLAGNAQQTTGGYSGDGGRAVGTTLNAPSAVAVDSVGNVYIADTANAVIREVNAQTGLIKIIAGVPPSKCTQTSCTANPAYTDGVAATSTGVGSTIRGLAVDGFGNVFFSDTNQLDIRVIFKGGAQVANLIALEDPTAASSASAVVPGNIYLLAGMPTAATKGVSAPIVDKVLASKATFHGLTQIGLDGAGNIYALDIANSVVRVINAQSTTQTFFGVSLSPGFIGSIVNCGALTTACGSGFGIGGPAGAATYGTALVGLGVDQFGSVYQVNTKGTDIIYGAVAYAGGAPLAHLLNLEGFANPTPGNMYSVLNANPNNANAPAEPATEPFAFLANYYSTFVLRPSAVTVDSKGNIYYLDNHYPSLYRVDVNSQVATRLNGTTATTGLPAVPAPCSTANPPTTTATTTDTYGDGCPSTLARVSGYNQMTTDGEGNLYLADSGQHLLRKLSINNAFPATALGTPLIQTLQVHFDGTNLPATTTATTSSPLQIQAGSADFSIATAPTCSNQTLAADASIDCFVAVTFKPTQPGLRTANLQATAQNGAVYNLALRGIGTGSALALDGGSQNAVAVTPPDTNALGATSSVAVDLSGNEYIADAANNRVLTVPAAGGRAMPVGTGLLTPQGVALDATGNVYIADTGNNRVVKVAPNSIQTTLPATGLLSPQSVAVDGLGNVYVADTGNKRVVEIPVDTADAPATLRQFNGLPGSDALVNPVAVAVDSAGNVYVADSGAKTVFVMPPGGGDLQNVATAGTLQSVPGLSVGSPSGVAVDAAGNVYVSDKTANVVTVKPSSTGPGSGQYNLSFSGLSAPAGLALDGLGNVYVADSGNSRVLSMNRKSAAVNFGSLGLFQPALSAPLTLINVGNQTVTLGSPVAQLTGDTGDFGLQDGCSGRPLGAGLACSLNTSFLPVAGGSFAEAIAVQGGVSASLQGIGVPPLGAIAVAISQAPAAGSSTAAVTATVTQPHGNNTPGGTVTFAYTINEGNTSRGGSSATTTVNLTPGANGASTATLQLTGLLPARRYSITATYNGDPRDTPNTAAPVTFIVPGGQTLTIVANPATFTYGSPLPTLTGTVTGILPADAAAITYNFVSPASATTPVGTYPISLQLSGGNYLNYVVPPAVTSTGAPALVTEAPAPLSITGGAFTSVYGAFPAINLPFTITGVVNGDKISANSPLDSSMLSVGTYPVAPTLSGTAVSNYTVTIKNGTLTITQAGTILAIAANAAAVLPTNLTSEQLAVTVQTATNFGTPTGTVTLLDTFTPFSTGVAAAPVSIGPLPLTNGAATYTPTSVVLGTHNYTVAYSGDSNFVALTNPTPAMVIVDNPDFFPTTPSSPLNVIPGTVPGGNPFLPGESAANPETQTITFTPILGYTGNITVTCSSPVSYITCTLAPSMVTISSKTPQTVVISVSTPATLPVDYKSELSLRGRWKGTLAFLPLGLLAAIPFARARKKRITSVLWMLLLLAGSAGMLSGCGSTLVKFYTPVPAGPQSLTITATDGTLTRSITMALLIQ